MKTLQEWVDFFNAPAYIFNNGFTSKTMFFIPICDYDTVEVDPAFDVFSFSTVKKNDEVICNLQSLIHHPFLLGDEHIFIVPIEFDESNIPEENIIYPSENS